MQLIARLFADRETANDIRWRTFNLSGACLSRVNWLDAGGGVNLYMPRARLFRADMRNAILRGSTLQEAVAGVDLLDGINSVIIVQTSKDIDRLWELDRMTFYRADFQGADLSETNAFRANFNGANFVRANLENASWQEAKLKFANMADANLFGIDLSRATVDGADLRRARLDFSHFREVKFTGVKLKDASFLYTNVAKAVFTNADFTKTDNLTEEQLRNLLVEQLRNSCVYPQKKASGEMETLTEVQPELPGDMAKSLGEIPSCEGRTYPFWHWFARLKTSFASTR